MTFKQLAYWFLDQLTLGNGISRHINGFKLKLPVRYMRYFPADYEAENFAFLRANVSQGDVVLDIGAHIGLFATAAASLVGQSGKVYAFEPAPATSAVLKETIRINQIAERVTIVNAAMGKETGTITFFVSETEADNSNSLVAYKEDRELKGIPVMVSTIDAFAAEQGLSSIRFIKIDVEGAEYDALKGGLDLLRRCKPFCILAIHPEPILKKGDRLEDIYDCVQELGYQIHYNGKPISREAFIANREMIDLHLHA